MLVFLIGYKDTQKYVIQHLFCKNLLFPINKSEFTDADHRLFRCSAQMRAASSTILTQGRLA